MIHAIRQYFARRAHVAAFIERNRRLFNATDADGRVNIHAAAIAQFHNPQLPDAHVIRAAYLGEYK